MVTSGRSVASWRPAPARVPKSDTARSASARTAAGNWAGSANSWRMRAKLIPAPPALTIIAPIRAP
jgi:hypothetical protein